MVKPIHVFFILPLVFLSLHSAAQPMGTFDDWGKVSMEEVKITECSFEKNADAILLLDLAQVYFSENSTYAKSGAFLITTSYYQRYKVLTEKGVRRATFRHVLRIQSHEEVKDVRAISYNLVNGIMKKTELAPDAVHTTKLNEYQTEVTFSIPDVKAGTVFEVEYKREQTVSYTLPEWFFSSSVPSVKSSITVWFLDAVAYYVDKHTLKGNWEETSKKFTSDIDLSGVSSSLSGTAITYTTHNLPSFTMEPYTNSSRNYMDWVGFELIGYKPPLNDNPNIINSFSTLTERTFRNPQFGANLNGNGIPKKEWKSLIRDNMSDLEKARAIFEFVRSNMKWNGEGGIWPKQTNNKIWKDKTGSYAEINLLLVNTLRQAGLKVYPMLFASRTRGNVNTTVPILDQFRGVNALLKLGRDSDLVLDATQKYLPFAVPPLDQLNTSALGLREDETYFWHEIQDNTGDKEYVSVTGEMDESGRLTGEMTLFDNSYTASMLINLKTNNKEATLNEWLKARIPNATIESVKDSMDIKECRFYYKVKFSAQAPADNDGNIYLSVPAIYGSTTNIYVNKERTTDVDMGYKLRSDVVMQIKIPDSYTIDSMVPSISLYMQDTSIAFLYDAEMLHGIVSMRQRVDYHRSFYPVEGYPAFFDFFQKYYALKQKPVVLKKKT